MFACFPAQRGRKGIKKLRSILSQTLLSGDELSRTRVRPIQLLRLGIRHIIHSIEEMEGNG